jgi:hypothetical protein
MMRFFVEGGLGMYPTLAFGLLLLAVGLAHAVRPGRRLVGLFTLVGAATCASGAVGATLGIVATFLHASRLAESGRFAATLAGVAESLHTLVLALVLVVLATGVLAAGALRAALAAGPEPRCGR